MYQFLFYIVTNLYGDQTVIYVNICIPFNVTILSLLNRLFITIVLVLRLCADGRAVRVLRERVRSHHKAECMWVCGPAPVPLSRPPLVLSPPDLYHLGGAAHALGRLSLPHLPQQQQLLQAMVRLRHA